MHSEGVLKEIGQNLIINFNKIEKTLKGIFSELIMNNALLESLLVLGVVSLSYVASGQVVTPIKLGDDELTFIEGEFVLGYIEADHSFYVLTNTEYWKLKMIGDQPDNTREWIRNYYTSTDHRGDAVDIKELTWITHDSSAYLVAEGSGRIYEFTGTGIVRLPNSYDQRSNSASAYFIYRDCIYNFSGYGYWQYPSFISKFNLKTQKLSAYLPNGGVLVPPSFIRPLHFYDKEEKLLYIWGGEKVAYTNSVSNFINNTNELWQLNLESKKWDLIGSVNMPSAFHDNIETDSFINFKSNDELFCSLGSKLYVFNIGNNRISTYKISEDYDLTVDANVQPAYSPSAKLLLLSTLPYPNQNVRRVKFVSLSNYRSELESETKLLKTHFKTIVTYSIIIILIIALTYLAYYIYKNYYVFRNKLIILRNAKTIKFNNKLIKVLDNEESELVFWIAQSEDYVSTTYIMDRPSDGSQSYESMKKRKLNTMKSIEVKLGAFSQVKKPVFKEKKSTEDLRLKEYKLNNDWIIVQD